MEAARPAPLHALATAALAAAIAVALLTPHDPLPQFFPGQDKAEHLAAMAVLTLVMLFGQRGIVARVAVLAVGVVLMELLQALFVPTRTASWDDAVWGWAGIAAGVVARLLGRGPPLSTK